MQGKVRSFVSLSTISQFYKGIIGRLCVPFLYRSVAVFLLYISHMQRSSVLHVKIVVDSDDVCIQATLLAL